MKILHVISAMTVEAGGPPFVCAGLAEAQARRGHEVAIATVDYPGQQRVAVASGVGVEYFPLRGTPRYAASPALGAWLSGHAAAYDIAHLHSIWQYPTFAAAKACQRSGIPYVVLLNGMLDVYSVGHRNYWLKFLYWHWREKHILRCARALHCLNLAEIRRAASWIGTMPKFVAGNGVSSAELAALPGRGGFRARHPEIGERPLALFLSRLHPKKGLDRLLPAWQELLEQQPEAVLVIAGTGAADYVAALDKLIAECRLTGRVIRVGQLAGRDKWAALVDADVFVLPSHQEGFSMAITEAMAAGCPVVVTEECNFDEVEPHQAGRIIRGGDMQAFVEAVAEILEDGGLRATYSRNGRRLVETRFTWERIARDLEEIYDWARAGKAFAADGAEVWRLPETASPAGVSPGR